MSIHGFNVALSPGVASPVTPTRSPAREIHLNVWTAGAKNFLPSQAGDGSVSISTGLTLVTPRPTSALANAPTELVLGDTAARQLLNTTELDAVASVSSMSLTGFYIP